MNGNPQGGQNTIPESGPSTIPVHDAIPMEGNEGTPSDLEHVVERRRTIHRPRFSERVRSKLYRLIGLRTPAEKAADERHAQWRKEEEETRAKERQRFNQESEIVRGKFFDARMKRDLVRLSDDERRTKFNATSPVREGEFFGAPIIQRSNTVRASPKVEVPVLRDVLSEGDATRKQSRSILRNRAPVVNDVVGVDSVPGSIQDIRQKEIARTEETGGAQQSLDDVLRVDTMQNFLDTETFSQSKENLPERAKSARERIGRLLITMKEKYKELPPHKKLLVSGALIGAGLATSGGSGVLGAAVLAASATVKGLGSYVAGESVEEGLRKYLVKKNNGQPLSEGKERFLKVAKYATFITSFVLSEWSDAKAIFHNMEDVLGSADTVNITAPEVTPTENISSSQQESVTSLTEEIMPEASELSPSVAQEEAGPMSREPVSSGHTNFIGTHEVIVRHGDSLSKILLHGGVNDMFSKEDLAGLTWRAKQNLLENIANNLTPNQLREVGITSGNVNILKLGEKIDVKKLADMAKDLTVLVGGERVPLLKRALDLSKMS